MDSPSPAELEGWEEDESHCGAIKPDYFALESASRRDRAPPPPPPASSDPESDSSDNPSWVDPDSSSLFADQPANTRASWSDSSDHVALDDAHQSEASVEESLEFDPSDPSRIELGSNSSAGAGEGAEKPPPAAGAPWWKLPLELVRLYAVRARARPLWAVSIAAAIVGAVMLGRKLYKMMMRDKGKRVPLRISLDEKKASQFMARAARLNEAFSIVRRAPIIRPSLASGVTPWPVVGLV